MFFGIVGKYQMNINKLSPEPKKIKLIKIKQMKQMKIMKRLLSKAQK